MGYVGRKVGVMADNFVKRFRQPVCRSNASANAGGMTAAAIAGVLAVLAVTAGAEAGSNTYDMSPMLKDAPALEQGPYAGTETRPAVPTNPARASQIAAMPTQQASVGLTPPQNGDPSFITISGGYYDVFDNEKAAELTAEWRAGQMFWIFKPFAGAMVTTDAAVYGFGGILTDFYFGRRIVVTPSIAAGLYSDGDGKDLGSVIEFRSGLEIGWRFDNRARLSAAIYHISNASIGSSNPGTEIVSLGYSFPLR